jgi:hypothetical protein
MARIVKRPPCSAIVAVVIAAAIAGVTSAGAASPPVTAQIAKTWAQFFDGSTPAAKKVQLLQNGARFQAVIEAQANSPLAKQTKVKVARVTLLGPARAKVLYTILLAGQPALPNQVGIAVRAHGTWQVSDQSFCALLQLEGAPPPACKGM